MYSRTDIYFKIAFKLKKNNLSENKTKYNEKVIKVFRKKAL